MHPYKYHYSYPLFNIFHDICIKHPSSAKYRAHGSLYDQRGDEEKCKMLRSVKMSWGSTEGQQCKNPFMGLKVRKSLCIFITESLLTFETLAAFKRLSVHGCLRNSCILVRLTVFGSSFRFGQYSQENKCQRIENILFGN